MLITIIKSTFIYFFCIYISKKSLLKTKDSFILRFIISLILAIISYALSSYPTGLSRALPLLILWIIVSIKNSSPQLTFITFSLSYVISYVVYTLFSLIVMSLTLSLYQLPAYFLVIALLSGFCQGFAIHKFFSLKRFRNGISLSINSTHINIATIFCLSFISFTIYVSIIQTNFHHNTIGPAFFIATVLTLAFLIYWWQAQISKSYRRSLEIRELESMRIEMAELKLQMKKVLEDNERLSRISHRDNTLLTSLKNATTQVIMRLDPESAEAIEAGKLLRSIEALGVDRAPVASESEASKARVFDTSFSLLDDVLNEMEIQSIRDNIVFSVHFGTNLEQFIPDTIAEIDVMHTVDDLLKNAFKSTLKQETRAVQLQFYKLGKHLVIEVADSGIPFEIESLVNMGLEKRTTYEDGSGIGLVEIWDIKDKYGATYHLEEYRIADPFTKRISIIFDKKNRYSIRTIRKTEILSISKRADLQVYDYTET